MCSVWDADSVCVGVLLLTTNYLLIRHNTRYIIVHAPRSKECACVFVHEVYCVV